MYIYIYNIVVFHLTKNNMVRPGVHDPIRGGVRCGPWVQCGPWVELDGYMATFASIKAPGSNSQNYF